MAQTQYNASIAYNTALRYDGLTDAPPAPEGDPNLYNRLFMLNVGRGMMSIITFLGTLLYS